MKARWIRVVLVLAALACAAGAAASLLSSKAVTIDERVPSEALAAQVHALVILPPGYRTSGLRYPVVYFLHGLPASAEAYREAGWVETALERAGPAILVEPQGARPGDTDPEYLNWGSGRGWETFVSEELVRYVDRHFRTIRSRRARAIVGLSAGGYGATILGLHHLGSFSAIESWSGYFHPTNPSGTAPLPRGPRANAHTLVAQLRADERTRPTFFAFYVGRGDARFRAENEQFSRELTAAGVRHVFELYAGGHSTALWERQAPHWLGLALAHLDAPTR
ncbi:MAG TPA: alpha/beta hydrolase-fold protein [Gaiellaceae bacterium]|nr:alpha/beta hydrolase-fold protein [Gaiellaceae bacterium]